MNPFRNSSRALLAALSGLMPLALGCAEEFAPASRVASLRVLVERADLPYAAPGETVVIDSLSHDPLGRPVTWAWATCVDPVSASVDGCLAALAESGGPSASLLAFGEGLSTVAVPIPADALAQVPEPARAAAMVGVLSVACPGELTLESGAARLPFRCREAETTRELGLDEFVVGLKRIYLRTSERNRNPLIARVTFDGQDWPEGDVKEVGSCDADGNSYDDCPSSNKHQLAAYVTPESVEAGVDEFRADFHEQLIVQYFATEGIFEHEIKTADEPKNGWVARKSAAGQELTLWFVARDDRGGVSWAERRVRVRVR